MAEAGEPGAPLVLLLHGFPEFWWSWRHQLVALADAGFRAVAPDLKGYGATDKPPRGYDVPTLSADVAGLVRALGERRAVVVGHDWGGLLAWSTATLHPQTVRAAVAVSMPHPRRLRHALVADPAGQLRASSYLFGFQVPRRPERVLVADDAAFVARLLHAWGGPGFPDPETERRCRQAAQIPMVAHSALEWYRWALRSQLRPDGARFARAMARPIQAPVLHLHGELDSCLLASTALGSGRYVAGSYTWRLLPGVGHFPHEEAPEVVTREILMFLRGLP